MSSSRLRLFVALDLPLAVREGLARWAADTFARPATGARPAATRALAASSLHVTLCFLGEREADDVAAIARACRSIERSAVVRLALGSPLWLPRRRPRVAAVELTDPDGTLARLQATLADALSDGGWYRSGPRPFLAHVTVARVARSGLVRPPGLGPPPPQRFSATSVSLYRSHTGPSGARYEPLATVALGS